MFSHGDLLLCFRATEPVSFTVLKVSLLHHFCFESDNQTYVLKCPSLFCTAVEILSLNQINNRNYDIELIVRD